MIANVTGVLVNGAPTDPGVPVNPRVELRLGKMETGTINLTAVTSDGAPVNLVGKTLVFTVRRNSADTTNVIRSFGVLDPSLGPGRAHFTIALGKTRMWPPGRYVYDIVLKDTLSQTPTNEVLVPLSPFIVEATTLFP